jgi:hypothetical protein
MSIAKDGDDSIVSQGQQHQNPKESCILYSKPFFFFFFPPEMFFLILSPSSFFLFIETTNLLSVRAVS